MTRETIRVLIAVHGSVDVDEVRQMVASQPTLQEAALIDNDRDWAGRVSHGADAILIVTSAPSNDVLALVAEEAKAIAPMPVIVLCGGEPGDFVQQVFEAGADDLLPLADVARMGAHVSFAMEKAITRRSKSAATRVETDGGGQVICVLGPKGGTGKTLTSSNLAVALAKLGKRVALVDLDLQFGDLGLVMGLKPERSIFDLVVSGGSLDATKLDAFMSKHETGVEVLLAPTRPDQASGVTSDFLRELYEVMRGPYDYIVVDTPPGFTAEVIATIDVASTICLIGTLDAPSLKNAKLGAETLEMMGYPSDRVRVVLNRADTKVGVSHADVVHVLGRAPDVLVPSSRDVVRSVNAGQPIVASSPRSEAAKGFEALASIIARDADAPHTPVAVAEPRRARRVMVRS